MRIRIGGYETKVNTHPTLMKSIELHLIEGGALNTTKWSNTNTMCQSRDETNIVNGWDYFNLINRQGHELFGITKEKNYIKFPKITSIHATCHHLIGVNKFRCQSFKDKWNEMKFFALFFLLRDFSLRKELVD